LGLDGHRRLGFGHWLRFGLLLLPFGVLSLFRAAPATAADCQPGTAEQE
jgi:hypothetical protein